MLKHDGAAIDGTDERRIHVSHLYLLIRLPRAGEKMLGIRLVVRLTRFEGHKIVEPVATVDVHVLAYRT